MDGGRPDPSRSMTREEVREYDRAAIEKGVPGIVLMENAGRGASQVLLSLGVTGPVVVVCGKGNNGGDGFVIARLLAASGVEVAVELVPAPAELTGDAALAFADLLAWQVPIRRFDAGTLDRLRRCEWIVDALLGTGFQGPVRPPYDEVIETINRAGRRVLAVDLPSGLDCDSGTAAGPAVRAEHTATFVARKLGFDNPQSAGYVGQVHVIDLFQGSQSSEHRAKRRR